MARAVVGRIDNLLDQLARGYVVLDDKRIRDTIRAYVEAARNELSDWHLHSPPRDSDEAEIHTGFMLDDLRGLQASLRSSNFSGSKGVKASIEGASFSGDIEAEVCKLFGLNPATEDTSDIQFKKACREWAAATSQLWVDHLKRLDGERTASDTDYLAATPPARPEVTPAVLPKGPRIRDVLEDFLEDHTSGRPIRENTVEGYRQHVRAFTDVLGDMPVATVTYHDARRLRDTLLKLPKNRNKAAAYRDNTVAEILTMEIPEGKCLQGRTVSEIVAALRTLFKWLLDTRKITHNPFDGLRVATDSKSYTEYASENLNLIFNTPLYVPGSAYTAKKTTTAGYWWLPLLALHTGTRPSELVQMRLVDVEQIDGVLCASVVDDEATGQQAKTRAGQRTFPVHPELLRLGFVEYLDELRQAGADRVLKGIVLGKRKAGDQAGKWFNERYRDKFLPGFKEERKTLYSFRHTFITRALNDADIELRHVQQMVGHERSQMGATKYYDKGAGSQRLFEEISKVDYQCPSVDALGQDWKHLKLFR